MVDNVLTVGQVAERTGLATSAIRFYEDRGLITSTRTSGGQRRFERSTIRRIAFATVAQKVGLSLDEIRAALDSLPRGRTPTEKDWAALASRWRPLLDERIAILERLRDRLDECLGCGCLSVRHCALANPGDRLSKNGPGPRTVLDR
jgi:MerR family redox-sensitive transcriptional activator SoxR